MEDNEYKERALYQSDEDDFSDENKLVIQETTTDSLDKENVNSDVRSERDPHLAQNLTETTDYLTVGKSFIKETEILTVTNDSSYDVGDFCSNLNTQDSRSLTKQDESFVQVSIVQKSIILQDSSAEHGKDTDIVVKKVTLPQLAERRCKNLEINQPNINTDSFKFNDSKKNFQIEIENSNIEFEASRPSKLEGQQLESLTISQACSNIQSIRDNEPVIGDFNMDTKISRPSKHKDFQPIRSKVSKVIPSKTTKGFSKCTAIPSREQRHREGGKSLEKPFTETVVRPVRVHTDQTPSTSGVQTQKIAQHTVNVEQNQGVKKWEPLLYYCKKCNHKPYKTFGWLNYHNKTVHGMGNCKCGICHGTFTCKFHLSQHRTTSHNHNHSFECCMCSARFLTMEGLTEHKKAKYGVIRCDPNCLKCRRNLNLTNVIKSHFNRK